MRFLSIILAFFWANAVIAECRHALILALDISGSVTWTEYRMQQRGLSEALQDPEVIDVILSDPEAPVYVYVFEWAGTGGYDVAVDWVALRNRSDIEALAAQITNYSSQRSTFRTAIGAALHFAQSQFERGPDCDRRTVDISGDGKSNVGPTPRQVYASGGYEDIVVNTLSIGEPLEEEGAAVTNAQLIEYYHREVNHGPGAFTIEAIGFEDYARAMKRKLIRELSPISLSYLAD